MDDDNFNNISNFTMAKLKDKKPNNILSDEERTMQYTKIGLMIIGLILFGAYLLK